MSERKDLPIEVLVSTFGNVELRKDHHGHYSSDGMTAYVYDVYIHAECRKSIIGAEFMKVKDLVSTGLAQKIVVNRSPNKDFRFWVWSRNGME